MGEAKTEGGGEKKAADTGAKKVDAAVAGPITAVFKLELHCEGCAKKVKKSIRHFEGVESVKTDSENDKLTVTGKVDPTALKERLEYKTKKKVELVSPQPKKDGGGGGGDKKSDEKSEKKADEKKTDEKKPKEPQVSTVVLKIPLHCDGCIHKMKRIISKIDGVDSVSFDAQKDLVTVKGTMNVKELTPYLKEKLKRNVDIVPAGKKDDKGGDKKDDKGGEKKDDKGGEKKDDKGGKKDDKGGDKKDGGGGGEKKKDGESKAASAGGDGISKSVVEVNRMDHYGNDPHTYTMMPPVYNYNYSNHMMPMYNQSYFQQDYGIAMPSSSSSHGYVSEGYVNHGHMVEYSHPHMYQQPPPSFYQDPHAHQMFSDENPNACSVM